MCVVRGEEKQRAADGWHREPNARGGSSADRANEARALSVWGRVRVPASGWLPAGSFPPLPSRVGPRDARSRPRTAADPARFGMFQHLFLPDCKELACALWQASSLWVDKLLLFVPRPPSFGRGKPSAEAGGTSPRASRRARWTAARSSSEMRCVPLEYARTRAQRMAIFARRHPASIFLHVLLQAFCACGVMRRRGSRLGHGSAVSAIGGGSDFQDESRPSVAGCAP